MAITDEDRRYFAALRVIARLMAVARVGRWWPTGNIPVDERQVLDDALALVGGYNDKGEQKVAR